MNKSECKYFNTALLMDQALLLLLEKKDLEFITIKEICQKAGVNRSTFYLHYENIYELLEETIAMLHKEFLNSFDLEPISKQNQPSTQNEAFLIKKEYLIPYLNFVKKNKRILKTIHNKPATFGAEAAYKSMYEKVFYPSLAPFNLPENKKVYILEYFTKGVAAIIYKWVEMDCNDDIEHIVDIILDCINWKV